MGLSLKGTSSSISIRGRRSGEITPLGTSSSSSNTIGTVVVAIGSVTGAGTDVFSSLYIPTIVPASDVSNTNGSVGSTGVVISGGSVVVSRDGVVLSGGFVSGTVVVVVVGIKKRRVVSSVAASEEVSSECVNSGVVSGIVY